MDKNNPAYRHGHAGSDGFSPTYHSWASMVTRCTNPNRPMYKYYGGRGISVCERWRKFENFLADMGERPEGLTLDRVDSDGNYEPGNCRWADRKTQSQNRRKTLRITIDGVQHTVAEWCELLNISIKTVRDRVYSHGWSYEEALTRPKQDRVAAAKLMTANRVSKALPGLGVRA